MKTVTLEFLLKIFEAASYEYCNDLFWRTDGEYAPVTFWVNCNDLFYWACADNEEITPENVELLKNTIKECEQYDEEDRKNNVDFSNTFISAYSTLLFCCRVRKMRPQGPYYKHIPKKYHYLFDVCGPERLE